MFLPPLSLYYRATIIRHGKAKVDHPNIGSVALPAILRAGDTGPGQFSTGSMQQAQFSEVSQQAHSGHVPPSVSDVLPACAPQCLHDQYATWHATVTTIAAIVVMSVDFIAGFLPVISCLMFSRS